MIAHEAHQKITSFTQLRTWQKSRKLVSEIYKVTKNFPKEEMFALTSQIRRSAISIPSNIAEGFSRASAKDKAHFYTMSLGSLTETVSHTYIAEDLGYLTKSDAVGLRTELTEINKMLNGMIKTAKGRTT